MSRIDTTFGSLAERLVTAWSMSGVVFLRSDPGTYDSDTGAVTTVFTRIPVKAVITRLTPKEYEGLYQSQDVKIIPDPTPLRPIPIKQSDFFEYPQNGRTVRAKIIDIRGYRGDDDVASIIIARPQ